MFRIVRPRSVLFSVCLGTVVNHPVTRSYCNNSSNSDRNNNNSNNTGSNGSSNSSSTWSDSLAPVIGQENANQLKQVLSADTFSAKYDELNKLMFESGSIGQIGYGFILGYTGGFCLKKMSKGAALVSGFVFVSMQTLAYNGYITVNFDKIQADVEGVLDINKDGKLDEQDAQKWFEWIRGVVGYNVPTGSGVTAGLVLGLRS